MNEEIKHRKIFAQHCKEFGQDYFMPADEAILFFEQMEDLQSRLEQAEKDSALLKFAFSTEKHDSMAIYELHERILNGNEPSIDDVREAIDTAMQSAKESK